MDDELQFEISYILLIRKLIKIVSLILFARAVVFMISVDCIRAELIASPLPDKTEITDSITVHFTHGYTVNEGCKYDKTTLAGYWGGHVEVEIDSVLYGHTLVKMPVALFGSETATNGRFEILNYEQWRSETEGDMMTSIVIPIDQQQENSLDSLIQVYSKESPYDYAFFGQRCTSFMVCFLSKAGVINEITDSQAIKAFFYPRPLRYTMLEYARQHDLTVLHTKGASCRNWEGD